MTRSAMWQVFFLGLTVGVRWEDFGNYVIFSQDKIFSDLSDLRKPQHSTMLSYELLESAGSFRDAVRVRWKF